MAGQRQREKFEQTMMPHLGAAFRLARWLIRHPQDAEDAVQESYLKAFRSFADYAGGDSSCWLLSIVRNTCLTRLRREASRHNVVRFEEASTVLEKRPGASWLANTARRPDESALEDEERESVRAAVHKLPDPMREVIVLREFLELSYAQIARVVGVPVGTVMSRLSRARQQLREILAAGDEGEKRNDL